MVGVAEAAHPLGRVGDAAPPSCVGPFGSKGTIRTARPPGRSIRTSSAIAAPSSGMCSSTWLAITTSTPASAKGSAVRSARMSAHGTSHLAQNQNSAGCHQVNNSCIDSSNLSIYIHFRFPSLIFL
jgi:hypothetical protein